MKKSLVSVLVGLLILGVSGNSWAEGNGPTARDVECNGCVNDTDIATSAVTESKLAAGAVTDAKITGPISASKIEKPANVIVVAKSGGDFTSIQAALDSITPSATNPYVIKVMPGTYSGDITMKSYVHLQGAGRDVVTLRPISNTSIFIELYYLTNVTISGFTITDALTGIANFGSSVTISDNMITGNIGGFGIYNNSYPASTAMTIISGNIFTGNSLAIVNDQFSSLVISGNTIMGSGNDGIRNYFCSPTISGNLITGNSGNGIHNSTPMSGGIPIGITAPTITGNTITGNGNYGISNEYASSPKIINNRITDNGGMSYTDIFVDATSAPNISFNVYDDITGDTGLGQFNVTSNGDNAPAP